jgi:hypothetical protein
MATTTPFYQWSVPTSSDLVKNGATAIETLGDSVDASLWNVGFGQAGKNKLINGDFNINQRAFTSVTTTNTYTFDRWVTTLADGTVTYTPQVFTPGTAPVAGYESTNFLRCVTTGQTLTTAEARIIQKIENVRSFAGQPVTISFWAKAATGTPSIALELVQSFGTSGSASVTGIIATKQAITTGWARYSWTGTVPSISGKTVGTTNDALQVIIWLSAGSSFNARTDSLGIQSNTFDIWGVQVEYGSKATPFQTATGTIQGELAACQRYYWRQSPGNSGVLSTFGTAKSTTAAVFSIMCPTTMRKGPESLDYSNVVIYDGVTGQTVSALTLGATFASTGTIISFDATSTTLIAYRPYFLYTNNANGYFGVSTEL